MVVRNNLSAINTLNTLNRNHSALIKSLQTVATGMRINSAKDDASGYAISERMRVEIASLDQANRNTQNGSSMMKVAEGAVQSTVDILKTLKEKVINAANDTNTDADRMQIQKELDQSIDQINDNANLTYNGKYLVDGSKNGKSDGTYTALTNESLDASTQAGTLLTDLKDRNGQNLNITTSDKVTVSYVQDGRTYSTSFAVQAGTTLADIVANAEDINPATITFATQANPSVAKVNGITNAAELLAQQQALQQAVTTAQGELSTAQTNLANAQAAVDAYTSAQGNVASKLGSLNVAESNDAFKTWASNYLAFAVGTGTDWNTLDTQYGQWKSATTSLGAPDPSTTSSYSCINSILNTTTSDSQVFRDAFTNYTGAYNALSALDSASSLSARQAALTAAKNDLTAKQSAYNTAVGNLRAFAGPTVLSDSKVGINYSGNIQYTPDLGTALTITAMNKGVEGQISGFTVSVTDSKGNIKKSVNAVLDAWNESIRGENASPEDNAIVLQTGSHANQAIKIRLSDMRARALGLQGQDGTTLNVSTQEKANAAINVLDNALQKALNQQTTIGSIESRLAYTSANLTTAIENLTASESTIRDADMAKAMTEYTKNNILMQASQAMLAQANQNNNQVLSLLR